MFLFLFKKKTIRPLKILLDIKDLMVMGGVAYQANSGRFCIISLT